MTFTEPKPRRYGWLVTALTFVSLIFALLAFVTPFNLIFGPLAIACGALGLIFNRIVWGGHDERQ